MPRRKQPLLVKCDLYAEQRKPDLRKKKMWDQRRKHFLPWPNERVNLTSLVHEEQTTKTCPRSNVLDAKNMDTTKGIVLSLRRTTTTREREKKLI